MLAFPDIDPVIVEIGPLAIRWYSLAYIAGIVIGAIYMDWLNKTKQPNFSKLKVFDDFLVWGIVAIILGGRLGYVLFYNTAYYASNPLAVLQVWQGGMSFHGGLVGMIIASILFCKKHQIPVWGLFDLASCAAPIGLFFGRVANFINAELYGRVTDVPWGVVFPGGGDMPRHPSQLYEAIFEGLFLTIILFIMAKYFNARSRPWLLSGVFMAGYGLSRLVVEQFREPDGHIGFIWSYITMGQILSLPMVIIGCYLIYFANYHAKKQS